MSQTQVFHITESASGFGWFTIIAVAVIVVVAGAMILAAYSIYGGKHARFEVSTQGLHIHGGLYGRLIPLDHLNLDGARIVNLELEPQLKPSSRRNGTSMPGLKVGWFRLRNGEKGYCFLTDLSRVVYVPTIDGFSVLMSVDDPAALLDALRSVVLGYS